MLTWNKEVAAIARNQYEAVLLLLSREELRKIAKEEHKLDIVVDAPKKTIIEKILNAKYAE